MKKQTRRIPAVVHEYGWDAQAAVPGLTITPYEVMRPRLSCHGVMFGEMRDGTEVVVKPHVKPGKAEHEAAQIDRVTALGLNTPRKIGSFMGNQAIYVLTEKYPGLRTLADLNWRRSVADRANPELARNLGLGARNLAELHSHGVSHCDYRTKNAGLGPDDEPVYFDLEKSQMRGWGRGPHVETTNDLLLLGGSVVSKGFLYDRSPSYRAGALRVGLVDPYMELVSNDDVDHDLLDRGYKVSCTLGKMVSIGSILKNSSELPR